jgi:hypothetical protein
MIIIHVQAKQDLGMIWRTSWQVASMMQFRWEIEAQHPLLKQCLLGALGN